MPPRHALDVLIAFRMDVTKLRYENWDEVIHYCRYSAMPVGRFMLDVHGESTVDLGGLRRAVRGPADQQSSAGLRQGLPGPQSRLSCRAMRWPRQALPSRSSGEARASAPLLQCLHSLAVRTERCSNESKSLSAEVKDFRLGLEISVIQTFRRQDRAAC